MTFSLLSRSSYTIHLLMVRVRVFYIGFVFFTLAFCFFFFFPFPLALILLLGPESFGNRETEMRDAMLLPMLVR